MNMLVSKFQRLDNHDKLISPTMSCR